MPRQSRNVNYFNILIPSQSLVKLYLGSGEFLKISCVFPIGCRCLVELKIKCDESMLPKRGKIIGDGETKLFQSLNIPKSNHEFELQINNRDINSHTLAIYYRISRENYATPKQKRCS